MRGQLVALVLVVGHFADDVVGRGFTISTVRRSPITHRRAPTGRIAANARFQPDFEGARCRVYGGRRKLYVDRAALCRPRMHRGATGNLYARRLS